MAIIWTNPRVSLMRERKKTLQDMCKGRGIGFESKDTKQKLVDKLCPREEANRETNDILEALGGTRMLSE